MHKPGWIHSTSIIAFAVLAGCSGSTEPTGVEGVASVQLWNYDTQQPLQAPIAVDGAALAQGVTPLDPIIRLPRGITTPIEVRAFDAKGNWLRDLETGVFSKLEFVPQDFASIEPVPGHNFRWDVTVNAPFAATAQLTIGLGATVAADARRFGPRFVAAD